MIDIPGKLDDWLIDQWRKALHFWSVQWALFGVVLLPIMQLVPELPKPIQEVLPPSVRAIVNLVWCVVYIVLRLKAQKLSA